MVVKCRKLRWIEQLARTGESRSAFTIIVDKHTERRLLESPIRRLKHNIRIYLK